MYSNAYVLSRIIFYLEQRTATPAAIDAYFSDAEIIELNQNKLVMLSPSPFRKDVILQRYKSLIQDAVRDTFQMDVDLTVIDEDEYAKYTSTKKKSTFVEFNSKYTFESFVVGVTNQHAYSAAEAVAELRTTVYNPLFLYGPSGIGKTHLVLAIANRIQRNHPEFNIIYMTGEQFTNEFIDSVRAGKNFEFREKYRSADLFLVDDIQYIIGREQTQNEFFNTFNALFENRSQIVLTSDRPPTEMHNLNDRMRTRFEWGLMVDLQPPDYETRCAIAKNKAYEMSVSLSNEVCAYIAENITDNVRLLEGSVKKIKAYHELTGMPIDVTNVARVMRDMFKNKEKNLPSPDLIIGEVARFYALDEALIRGTQKNKTVVEARQIAMYLIRTMAHLSLPDTASYFGKNHTTVLHAEKKIEEALPHTSNGLRDNIRDITANINARL